jgi:hypothetical protein
MTDRFSIHQQIEEIDRELRKRREVYPRWVRQGKLRQSEAEYFLARMTAARKTLAWVAEHEKELKELAAALKNYQAAERLSTSPESAVAASSGE